MGKMKEHFNPMSLATDEEVFEEATARLKKSMEAVKGKAFWSGRFLWDVIVGSLLGVMTEKGEQIYSNLSFTPPPVSSVAAG